MEKEAVIDKTTSRFVKNYLVDLIAFCDELESSDATIIAISRKGPRLIELLVREGLLKRSILRRVVSEHAVPFYSFKSNEEIILIDDSILFGSTYNRIYDFIINAAKEKNASIKLIGISFALSSKVRPKYFEKLSKYFYRTPAGGIAPLIDAEVTSFKLIGKPYDIEHPIMYLNGDFSDDYIFENILNTLVQKLRKTLSNDKIELIPNHRKIATGSGVYTYKNWTILLSSFNNRKSSGPEFCKLRIFINPEGNRVSITAISPFNLSKELLENIEDFLPQELHALWEILNQSILIPSPNSISENETKRSRIILVNYLLSFITLQNVYNEISDCFEFYNTIKYEGINEYDTQLLIGTEISSSFTKQLNNLLIDSRKLTLKKPLDNAALMEKIFEEKFPPNYVEGYNAFLNEKLSLAETVGEVMSNIFYTQRLKIERPLRANPEGEEGEDRLGFGVTLKYVKDLCTKYLPKEESDDYYLHLALDQLIDDGCIVPKFMDMAKVGSDEIWVRVFRMGENTVPKRTQALILIHEILSKALGTNEINSTLLEKFSVLSLTNDFGFSELNSNIDLEILKGYGLYGARTVANFGQRQNYLLEWAQKQNIYKKTPKGDLVLTDGIRGTYPSTESPMHDSTVRKIEDIAAFCQLLNVTKALRNKSLVTITTLASKIELYKALSAELELWLYYPDNNFLLCVNKLAELSFCKKEYSKNDKDKNKWLQKVNQAGELLNRIITENANYTSQVGIKIDYFRNKEEINKSISEVVNSSSGDRHIKHVWEDISRNIEQKKSKDKTISGEKDILSALRVAHALTSLLRSIYALSGFQKSLKVGRSVELSLNRLLKILNNDPSVLEGESPLSPSSISIFEGDSDCPNVKAILEEKISLLKGNTSFSDNITQLAPLLSLLYQRCEEIYHNSGPLNITEKPTKLSSPKFLLMWDICKSTEKKERVDEIDPFILTINRKISNTFKNRISDFKDKSGDDGNGFICDDFGDVLKAFDILNDCANEHSITLRAGCDVNVLGDLFYYEKSKVLSGRFYEYVARIRDLYKEYAKDYSCWTGSLPSEPQKNYLLIGEFVERMDGDLSKKEEITKSYNIDKLEGTYKPRIKNGFPYSVSLLTPR